MKEGKETKFCTQKAGEKENILNEFNNKAEIL